MANVNVFAKAFSSLAKAVMPVANYFGKWARDLEDSHSYRISEVVNSKHINEDESVEDAMNTAEWYRDHPRR